MNTASLRENNNQIWRDLQALVPKVQDKALQSQLDALIVQTASQVDLSQVADSARELLQKVKKASAALLPQIEAIERAIELQFPKKPTVAEQLVENCAAFVLKLLKECRQQNPARGKSALVLFHYFGKEDQKVLAESIRLIFKRGLPEEDKSALRKLLQRKFPLQYTPNHFTLCYIPQYFFIGLEGVEILAEHLRKKGALKLASTTCVEENVTQAIESQLQKGEIPHLFFVKAGGDSAHISTLLLQKDSRGALQLIWIDSLGGLGALMMMQELRKVQKLHDIALFRLLDQRQRDSDGCTVFALHDAIQLCQAQERFARLHEQVAFQAPYKFIEPLYSGDFRTFNADEKPVNCLVGVPLGFWLPTQSFEQLDELMQGRAGIEKKLERIDEAIKTLEERIEANQVKEIPEDEKTREALALADQLAALKESKKQLMEKLDKAEQLEYFKPTAAEQEKFDKRLLRYTREVESPTASGEKKLKKQNHFVARQKDKYEGILWQHEILRPRT